MNGNKAILDTNIIIFASKRLLEINDILESYDTFCVSIITLMEVYGHNFKDKNEKILIDELFENIEIIDIDYTIAQKVINYRKSSNRKIKLPDAIILASASTVAADLITDDWGDFEKIDSSVSIVRADKYKKTF